MAARLFELNPAARGSQDLEPHNLNLAFFLHVFISFMKLRTSLAVYDYKISLEYNALF